MTKQQPMKVLARHTHETKSGKVKTDYYVGVVLGRAKFERSRAAIFNHPEKTWSEDKLLIRMSDGTKLERWESETFRVVSQ